MNKGRLRILMTIIGGVSLGMGLLLMSRVNSWQNVNNCHIVDSNDFTACMNGINNIQQTMSWLLVIGVVLLVLVWLTGRNKK